MKTKYWHTNKGFINPEGSIITRGFKLASIIWIISRIFKKPYKIGVDFSEDHMVNREEAIKLLVENKNNNYITWLGHATFLFNLNGIKIITDPLLFGNPGPSIIRGLKRLPCPLKPEDLDINMLLISHEHLDHLHYPTLKGFNNKEKIQLILPLGISKKIKKLDFKESISVDWFDKVKINNHVTIRAVPAVHYSNLSNSTLWAGFIISYKKEDGSDGKIYFAGDSDYGEFITRDIAPYGPFDFACIGIGGYYLPFPSRAEIVHTNPKEAIKIAKELDAKTLIGMHWGTIRMSDEDPKSLLPQMQEHSKEIDYKGEIKLFKIGETIKI